LFPQERESETDTFIRFTVTDTGIRIAEDKIDSILTALNQTSNPRKFGRVWD
jgi:signal transduction histidine kinase